MEIYRPERPRILSSSFFALTQNPDLNIINIRSF